MGLKCDHSNPFKNYPSFNLNHNFSLYIFFSAMIGRVATSEGTDGEQEGVDQVHHPSLKKQLIIVTFPK